MVNESTTRGGKATTWLLILWVAGVMLGFTWRSFESFNTPKEAILKSGIVVLSAVVGLRWLKEQAFQLVWHPIVIAGAALWMWGWFSLIVSPQSVETIRAQWFALYLLSLLVLVPVLMDRRGDLERCWSGIVISGGILGLVAVAQWFGFDFLQGFRLSPAGSLPVPKVEIYSTIGNSNYLAAALAFLLPVTIALATGGSGKQIPASGRTAIPSPGADKRGGPAPSARYPSPFALLLWGCAALDAAALLLTRSKGGLVAALCGLAALWLFWGYGHGWPRKRFIVTGVWGIGLSVGLILLLNWQMPSLNAEWQKLLRLSWDDPSVKGRLLMWNAATEMVKAHPVVGIGTGTFGGQYQPYRALVFDRLPDPAAVYPASEHSYDEAGHAHNDWFQVASENGMVGLALFILFVICLFVGCVKLLRGTAVSQANAASICPLPFTPHPAPSHVLCGLLAGMAAMLMHALVDFPLHQPVAVLLFWLGAASIVAVGGRRVNRPLPPRLTPRFVQWMGRGMIVLVAGLLVIQAVRPLVAGAYQRAASEMMNGRQWAAALPMIEGGLRWEPLQPELTLYLGVVYYQLGNLDGSRAAYIRYQSLYSDYQTLYNLGLIAVRQRQLNQAEAYFKEALRLRPTLAVAATALALVAEQTGRPDEASRYRQKAVQLGNAGA